MSKKNPWGVKWGHVGTGALFFLGAGIPAAIFYFGYGTIHIGFVAAPFTGLLVLLWGLMGEGAKY